MKKLQPILQFIDENGGWADEETGNFLGIDNLTKTMEHCQKMLWRLLTLWEFSWASI